MKRNRMMIMMSCAAVSLIATPIVGSYSYLSHNEEIVNLFNIQNNPEKFNSRLLMFATVSNATLSIATKSNATSSNWSDTDLDSDELEWIQGDNVELTNDLSE